MDIYKQHNLFDEIKMVSLAYPGTGITSEGLDGQLIVSNYGDGDLFLSNLTVDFKVGSFDVPLEKIIVKASTVILPLEIIRDGDTFVPDGRYDVLVLASKSGVLPGEIMYEALRDDRQKCVRPRIYSNDHPRFSRFREHYRKDGRILVTAPVASYLNLVSLRTGKRFRSDIPNVMMTFEILQTPECRSLQLRAQ